jgi:uncharacterized protein (DUF2236 family)
MPMMTEDERVGNPLIVSREPKGPAKSTGPGSAGDQAFKDAVTVLAIAWLLVFLLYFSVRNHNA